jgi:S-adenosylmethionine hydrolase
VLTLLTDFGTADGYVGEMKGVLASRAPGVPILDIAHDLAPQDVEAGRLTLARYWRRFPEGTVHLVVIDPGVGSARAAIAIESMGRRLVGPDNGVLSPALLIPGARAVRLDVPDAAAPTFHGRDVFAPAAAMLACGAPLEDVGEPFADPLVRRTPEPRRTGDGALDGEIMTIDRFGNCVTNLLAPRGGTVQVGDRTLGAVRRTYADVPPGAPAAFIGSTGLVEIAVRNGHAASALGLQRGDRIVLRVSGT